MSHILHLDRSSVKDINFFSEPTTTVQEYFQQCIDHEENDIHRRILKEILSCIQTIEKNYNLYHDTAVTPTWRVRTRSRISDLTRLVVAVGDSKAVALLSLFLHRKRLHKVLLVFSKTYFCLFMRKHVYLLYKSQLKCSRLIKQDIYRYSQTRRGFNISSSKRSTCFCRNSRTMASTSHSKTLSQGIRSKNDNK